MQRIAIVGPGGAGKSVLAKELGRRLDLPVIHLDEHYWGPGWHAMPRPEWRRRQGELLAGPRWIADGNYSGTIDERLRRADTAIILQPGRLYCVGQALRRSIRHHGQAIQAPGCPERVDLTFLRWIWDYPKRSRPRLDAALGGHGQVEVIELRSRAAASRYLDAIAPH